LSTAVCHCPQQHLLRVPARSRGRGSMPWLWRNRSRGHHTTTDAEGVRGLNSVLKRANEPLDLVNGTMSFWARRFRCTNALVPLSDQVPLLTAHCHARPLFIPLIRIFSIK
jgi:hypothetical protein